jgi:ribosome biogenesis protein MAK21
MFIALILRAMKRDVNLKRVAAFSKRLLQVIIKLPFLYRFLFIRFDKITQRFLSIQIALQQPPQYACACLFLLSELFKARPPLW